MDEDIGIDTSWMNEEEVIEKEEMDHVHCYFVYIDEDDQIEDIYKESCSLEKDGEMSVNTKISQNRLLGLIQRNKARNGNRYRLMDILQYNVPYDFPDLHHSSYSNIMKVVTTKDEIMFEPSLCIFHEINSIFFIFQEIPKYWNDSEYPMKPALKIMDGHSSNIKKKTKKVTFKDLDLRHTKKYRG